MSHNSITRVASRRDVIPPSLRPLCRAYALGHLATTTPRLCGFLRVAVRRDIGLEQKLHLLYSIIRASIEINRFPTSCAIIVGGATALPRLVRAVLQWVLNLLGGKNPLSLGSSALARIRFICSFLSAWLAFNLLNRDQGWSRKRARSLSAKQEDPLILDYPNQHHLPPPLLESDYAGKTIDFTLFAFCRALETVIKTTWVNTKSSPRHPSNRFPTFARRLQSVADPLAFATSASVIMWSWFYSPERLPKSYRKWISTAADIDPIVIHATRLCRSGDFVYGEDTGQATLLADLCRKLNHSPDFGDPVKTIPIPCELYHCGTGPSCEYHALSRFVRSWTFAMKLYLPLQLLTHMRPILALLRGRTRSGSRNGVDPIALIVKILRAAALSSSFLAAFISTFYYSVCLSRTRLGPSLFPTVSRQAWDSGLSVLAGCMTCGWSVLLENRFRRQEIAQFVAPRALATLLPRVYDAQDRWKEQSVFAGSVAVVMGSVVGENRRNVRGVLGRVLGGVVAGG